MRAAAAKIVIKSPREIELLRAAGRVVHRVLTELGDLVRPGVTTAALDARADELIRAAGAVALFKGVRNPQARMPFPACICASLNEQVVHGIPDDRPLREGDILSIDCGVRLKGYCGDAAATFPVGRVAPAVQRLLDVTRAALELAVQEIRPGRRWSQVARLMQKCVEDGGFGVVREFVGHGIGQEMREEPKVPNYYDRSQRHADFDLLPGMTLAIEPMVTAGRPEVRLGDASGWPVVTRDGSWAAHFEHSVAVTADGVEVLTDGN
ncbi:MAG TPA: type I methionyl aminopeptidase [Phycisphaerae bacterium]|nr:type I methionyl aminopeptidase [Phycisphaerae bacterium]